MSAWHFTRRLGRIWNHRKDKHTDGGKQPRVSKRAEESFSWLIYLEKMSSFLWFLELWEQANQSNLWPVESFSWYINSSYIIHKYLTLGSHVSTFCSVCVCVCVAGAGWVVGCWWQTVTDDHSWGASLILFHLPAVSCDWWRSGTYGAVGGWSAGIKTCRSCWTMLQRARHAVKG